jgi:hypothetical protein
VPVPLKFASPPAATKICGPLKYQSSHIGCCCKFLIPSHLFCFLIVQVLLSVDAFGFSLWRGTYYAVAISKDLAVIAIDSRSINLYNPSAAPDDRYCKIHPLADDLIFFSTGMVKGTDGIGNVIFDAADNALLAYAKSPNRKNLEEMASLWDDYMKISYKYVFALHPDLNQRLNGKQIIKGFFVGLDRLDIMVISSAKIEYSSVNGLNTYLETNVQKGNDIPFVHGGHTEVINEYIEEKTPRAKEMRAEVKESGNGKPMIEALAVTAESFVRAVRDWSGDPTIGGDIAVITLERAKKWRWFHRPDFCPEK